MGFPGTRARATIGRIIDIKLINQVIDLLKDYAVIHIDLFTSLFNRKHGYILDASALGFDDGLRGFFREISDVVTLLEDGNIRLKIEQTPSKEGYINNSAETKQPISMILDRINKRREKNLFDPGETLLWSYEYEYLLQVDFNRITIDKSPLELNLLSNKISSNQVTAIHKALIRHPNGIKLNELRNYYQFNLRSFSSISLDTLTVEYPELFYRVEPETDGEEALIYDGKTRTLDGIGGKLTSSYKNPREVCTLLIKCGLYQKTLILIKKAFREGLEGLKLAVWRSTIKINEGVLKPSSKTKLETKFLNEEPLKLFLALASEGFVQIKSHRDSKNDLRIFFPTCALDLDFYFGSARRGKVSVDK